VFFHARPTGITQRLEARVCPRNDDDNKPGSVSARLTADPSWSLIKLMTTPIGELAKSKGSGGPGSAGDEHSSLETKVEELIAEAEARAAATGQSIETVLQTMGVLDSESGLDNDVARTTEKGRLAETLAWEFQSPGEGAGPPGPTAPVGQARAQTLTLLLTRHPGAAPDELEAFIDSCLEEGGTAHGRLGALGLLHEGEIRDPDALCDEAPSLPGFPASAGKWKSLYERMLVDEVLGFRDYQDALTESQTSHESLDRVLTARGLLAEAEVLERIGAAFELLVSDGEDTEADVAGLDEIPAEVLEQFEIVPLSVTDDSIRLGVRSPVGPRLMAHLERIANRPVVPVLLPRGVHADLMTSVSAKLAQQQRKAASAPPPPIPVREILTRVSAVKIVQEIFEEAIEAKATDIHLDPKEAALCVRYRVDSVLADRLVIGDRGVADEVLSRIKILADLDTTERRRPQDGHVRAKIGGAGYDMRIATVPTYNGERMAIRIADPGSVINDIHSLGLPDRELDVVTRLIKRPHGMVLATGPVGSGKTTTLYTCLRQLQGSSLNIMTIEDPVENQLQTANQISVNYRIGFDFVKGLRAILRHDPDVILVGEIRDEETARIAVRASLTGLLVFSTLHAHTAAGAVTALLNFGIPPFLLGNSVLGVVAQRLVRKVCPECRAEYEPIASELASATLPPDTKTLVRGTGCPACQGTGYQGRTGIFEVLETNPDIRNLILERAPERKIQKAAVAQGMSLLHQGGRQKVLEGITTTAEMNRVLDL